MSYWPFVRLAKKAEANYPIRKTTIVDSGILSIMSVGRIRRKSESKVCYCIKTA